MEPDSVVVHKTEKKKDNNNVEKTAIMHIQYVDGTAEDTLWFAEEGSKIYMLLNLDFPGLPAVGSASLGTRWVLIADSKATSEYTGLEIKGLNIELDVQGAALPATLDVIAKGKNEGAETLTIGGKQVQARRYSTSYGLVVKAQVPFVGQITIPVSITGTVKFAKNIGMVYEQQNPISITIPITNETEAIPGFRTQATAYGNIN